MLEKNPTSSPMQHSEGRSCKGPLCIRNHLICELSRNSSQKGPWMPKSNQSLSFRELWMEDAHKRWRQREMMQQKGQEHNAQIAGADHYILTNVPAVHEVPWASYAKPPTPEPTWGCIWPLQPDRAFECHLFGLQYTGLCVTYKDRGNEDSNEWNSLEALKDLLLPRRTGDIIWKQTKT